MESEFIKWLVGAGSGGGAMGLLWFIARRLQRTDNQEAVVSKGWEGLMQGLQKEIVRLQADQVRIAEQNEKEQRRMLAQMAALEIKVDACDVERQDLLARVEAFERRYGTRRDDEQRAPVLEKVT